MEAEVEPCDDAEVAAAAAERPEELCVLGLVRLQHGAVDGDDLGADEVVAGRPCRPIRKPIPAERQAADASGPERAAWRGQAVRLRRPVERPPRRAAPARAIRASASTSISFSPDSSITSPPSQTACPATLWPPPRTATGSPCSAAIPSATTTSAVLRQRAIATGRRSTSALKVVRASS